MTMRHRHPRLELCWLATFGVVENGDPMPLCDGRLVRCHLIPKRLIRREGGREWDSRAWVWACGGIVGNGGHHGMLDHSRTLRLPRSAIPAGTEQLALELGLIWWLEREYGVRS